MAMKVLKCTYFNVHFRTTKTVVIVNVLDAGLAAPVFSADTYNIVVSEGVLSSSSVFQADASDPDGDGLTYSMQQVDFNNQQNPDFVITPRFVKLILLLFLCRLDKWVALIRLDKWVVLIR